MIKNISAFFLILLLYRSDIEKDEIKSYHEAACYHIVHDWSKLMSQFSPENIFNADEIALYYLSFPKHVLFKNFKFTIFQNIQIALNDYFL